MGCAAVADGAGRSDRSYRPAARLRPIAGDRRCHADQSFQPKSQSRSPLSIVHHLPATNTSYHQHPPKVIATHQNTIYNTHQQYQSIESTLATCSPVLSRPPQQGQAESSPRQQSDLKLPPSHQESPHQQSPNNRDRITRRSSTTTNAPETSAQ